MSKDPIIINVDSCGGKYTRFLASVNGCADPVIYDWHGGGDKFTEVLDYASPNPTFIVEPNCGKEKRTDEWTSSGSDITIQIVQEGICELCDCEEYEYRLKTFGDEDDDENTKELQIVINVDSCGGVYYASPICQRKCTKPESEWHQFTPFSVKWEEKEGSQSNGNISLSDRNSLTQTFVVNDKFNGPAEYTATIEFEEGEEGKYTVVLTGTSGTCCECLNIDTNDIVFHDDNDVIKRYISNKCVEKKDLVVTGESDWVTATTSITEDYIVFTAKEKEDDKTYNPVKFTIEAGGCTKDIIVKRSDKGSDEYKECKCPQFPSRIQLKPGTTVTYSYTNVCGPLTANFDDRVITVEGTGKISGNLIISAKNEFTGATIINIEAGDSCDSSIEVSASVDEKDCGCNDLMFTNGSWESIEFAPSGETKSISFLSCDDIEVDFQPKDVNSKDFLTFDVNNTNGTINITSQRNCDEDVKEGTLIIKMNGEDCNKNIQITQSSGDCSPKCECSYFNVDVNEVSWSCGDASEKKVVNVSADSKCFSEIKPTCIGEFECFIDGPYPNEDDTKNDYDNYTITVWPKEDNKIVNGSLKFTYKAGKDIDCERVIGLSVLPSEDCLCSCSSFAITSDEQRLIWTNEEAKAKSLKTVTYSNGGCLKVKVQSTTHFTVKDDKNGNIEIKPKSADQCSDELEIIVNTEDGEECDRYKIFLDIEAGCPCYQITLGAYDDGIPCTGGNLNIPLIVETINCNSDGDDDDDDDDECYDYEYNVTVEITDCNGCNDGGDDDDECPEYEYKVNINVETTQNENNK